MDITELLTSHTLERLISDSLVSRLKLGIQGIEVTQAIQYFDSEDHLTDPADRGPDNGIRLVSGKPAWVRVYLWSAIGASALTGPSNCSGARTAFSGPPLPP